MNYLVTKKNLLPKDLCLILETFEDLCYQRGDTLHIFCYTYKVGQETRYKGFKITPDTFQSFWAVGINQNLKYVWDLTKSYHTFNWKTFLPIVNPNQTYLKQMNI